VAKSMVSEVPVIKVRLSAIDADEFMSQKDDKKLLIILYRKQSLFIRDGQPLHS
jgi:hypothetical protein